MRQSCLSTLVVERGAAEAGCWEGAASDGQVVPFISDSTGLTWLLAPDPSAMA